MAEPTWLLAGGRNKGFDFADLAAAVVQHARGAAFYGAAGDLLRDQATRRSPRFPCARLENLPDAVRWCYRRSDHGEAIVLSPGCASTDQFINYVHRGETFARIVKQLAAASACAVDGHACFEPYGKTA
jgi:UDP-N-acetylmuramoylalanine--D-glutamate ligase